MVIEIKKGLYFSLEKEAILKLIVCLIWVSMLLTYTRSLWARLPFFQDHIDEIVFASISVPILFALPAFISKYCLADYLFFFALVFHYLFSYVLFPENTVYLNDNALMCIFCVFPFYFIGRVFKIEEWFDTLTLLSAICISIDIMYFFVYAPGRKNMAEIAGDDNMFAAYQVLPHVMMMLWATLKSFRIWKAIVFVGGVLFLLSCGTRGPFACLLFFGIIYFLFYMRFKGAIYVKSGIIAMVLVMIVFMKDIIYFLVKTFTGLQLSTRILERIVAGGLDHDSYRSSLRDKLYNALDHGDHFWGLGIFGCRNYDIIYPHILHLDFFCSYGYFVGSILLILLFGVIAWAFWITRGKTEQVFIVFLFSISIIKLMLSGTYILEPFFYFLIGACAKVIFFRNSSEMK